MTTLPKSPLLSAGAQISLIGEWRSTAAVGSRKKFLKMYHTFPNLDYVQGAMCGESVAMRGR
jgi:hypothetical protein